MDRSRRQKTAPAELNLAPGQTATLSGAMPEGSEGCELRLDPDAFTWDDRLPLLLPHPTPLAVALGAGDAVFTEFFQHFLASLENTAAPAGEADLRLAVYDTLRPKMPTAPAIVFSSDPGATKYGERGNVTERDPLTEGLNFSGLLCREALRIPAATGDRTLVWQGDRPLIFIRPTEAGPLLVLNFDLRASNATRLPGLVLLMNRFAEQVRAAKVFPETGNYECRQALGLAADPRLPAPVMPGADVGPLRAPEHPGFFSVSQGSLILLRGAARFADVREADFTGASSADALRQTERRLIERNSRADFLTPVWLLALGVVMAGSWTWKTR